MEGIGLKSVADFIDNIEYNPVDVGMQGAVALAVQPLRIGPFCIILRLNGGSFVELRIFTQQGVRLFCPGLMPQKVHLRNEPDTVIPAGSNELVYVGFCKRMLVLKFRVRCIGVVPIYSENQQVDLCRSQLLLYEFHKQVYSARRRCLYGKAADGKDCIGLLRRRNCQCQHGKQGGDQLFHAILSKRLYNPSSDSTPRLRPSGRSPASSASKSWRHCSESK